MNNWSLAILFIIFLSACGPQAADTPTLHIAISPAAQPVSDALGKCVSPNDEVGFSIDVRYPNMVDINEYDLFIALGEPNSETGFAAQLAWENIIIAINPSNDVDVSRDAAAQLFSGRVENWSDLGGDEIGVSLWVGSESDEARQVFESEVLLGSVSGNAHLATNPADAVEAVADDAGALAILPAAWADETIKQIDLNLVIPVLAITAEEPNGALREVLACLQGPIGQDVLSEKYIPYQQ